MFGLKTPEDSAGEGRRVTYAATEGARVVFEGGRRIRGFEAGTDGVWRVSIPEAAGGAWRFEQLFVNGRRAVRVIGQMLYV